MTVKACVFMRSGWNAVAGRWHGDDLAGPAWLFARGYRLAPAATHLATAGGRLIATF